MVVSICRFGKVISNLNEHILVASHSCRLNILHYAIIGRPLTATSYIDVPTLVFFDQLAPLT